MDQSLQVTVQVLVGVEFRGIGGQEEDLDVFRVLFSQSRTLLL
jgi:hypothetical protein